MEWPLVRGAAPATWLGPDTSDSTGSTIVATASATPHTMGGWVEVSSAWPMTTDLLVVALGAATSASATDTSTLLDVGIGAAGSEVVVLPSLPVGARGAGVVAAFPLAIPAGVRIAVRCQSAVASKTIEVHVAGLRTGGPCGQRATAYGASSATSTGETLATPAAANTDGSWTEVTSATTAPARWLVPVACGRPITNYASATGMIDVGIGAAGSEAEVVADAMYTITTSESIAPYTAGEVPAALPPGSRIAARYRSSTSLSTGAPAVVVYGID